MDNCTSYFLTIPEYRFDHWAQCLFAPAVAAIADAAKACLVLKHEAQWLLEGKGV
jgi:hypothetical protein